MKISESWLPEMPVFFDRGKASLRKSEARPVEELDDAIAAALDKVTSKDAHDWFASCGYSLI